MATMQYPDYRIPLKQMKQYMRYASADEKTVWRELVNSGKRKKSRFEKDAEVAENADEGAT